MLPVINAFKTAHRLTDVTVVADAGLLSEANQTAIQGAGVCLSLAPGSRICQTWSVGGATATAAIASGCSDATYRPDRSTPQARIDRGTSDHRVHRAGASHWIERQPAKISRNSPTTRAATAPSRSASNKKTHRRRPLPTTSATPLPQLPHRGFRRIAGRTSSSTQSAAPPSGTSQQIIATRLPDCLVANSFADTTWVAETLAAGI